MASPSFKKTVLANGIRVLSEHHSESHSVSLGLWIEKTGVRYEPQSVHGISHLIEHMVFKGTQTRSSYELARSLEAVGGELNAFTGREYTCFQANCLKEDLQLSMDVLCDLISNAKMDKKDLEREREVVLQEIRMSEDELEDIVFDDFFASTLKDDPAGWSILGTEDVLRSIDTEKIFKFYESHYQNPESIIVSAAGSIEHDNLVQLVEKFLGHFKKLEKIEYPKAPEFTPGTHIKARPVEQSHLLFGWPVASYTDNYRFESYIVNTYLGGGMTSKLYQLIREERGMAYNLYSMLTSFRDFGLNMFYVGTTSNHIPEVTKIVGEELKSLVANGMSEELTNSFKHQVRGQILLSSQDLESRMNSLAVNEWLYGEYRSVDRVISDIAKVTSDSVKRYLEQSFEAHRVGAYLIGQVDGISVDQIKI